MTKTYHLFIYLVLGILLLAGSKESRISKADFLGKTLFFPFISSVRSLNTRLELEVNLLRLQDEFATIARANNQLQQELEYYRCLQAHLASSSYEHVLASVVGVNGVYGQKFFILDQGSSSGIIDNMPVMDTAGIIGKIVTVGKNYSLLLPVNHSQFKAGVMLKKNHLQGLLEADFSNKVSMNMLPMGSEVSLGDTVITSNLSRIFPAYYPVGTIAAIRKSSDNVNISAEVQLFSNMNALTTVIVLLYECAENYQEELNIKNESEY